MPQGAPLRKRRVSSLRERKSQLAKEVAEVELNRLRGHEEGGGDFLVRFTFGDKLGDPSFGRRQVPGCSPPSRDTGELGARPNPPSRSRRAPRTAPERLPRSRAMRASSPRASPLRRARSVRPRSNSMGTRSCSPEPLARTPRRRPSRRSCGKEKPAAASCRSRPPIPDPLCS
jgi:hypothetical protein